MTKPPTAVPCPAPRTTPLAAGLAALAALLLGCAPAPPLGEGPAPGATPTPVAASPAAPAATPAAPPATPSSTEAESDWTLTPRGAGPVRFGMTLEELRGAVDLAPLGPEGECAYVVPAGAPEGLAFMVFEERVVRADIRRGSGAPNALGLAAGDSEERALAVLGPATEVTPHKYVEGHYLTARTGEGETFWVVETDQGAVTDLRAGLMPQVRWIEGCS